MNTNYCIPTSVVDDFFDNPEWVRSWALSLDYEKNSKGAWPGKRSKSLHEIDPKFFEFVINRFMSLYYYNGVDLRSADPSFRFSWVARAYFQSVDSSYGEGWIHRDQNSLITGIIYLNQDYNLDAGTTIYTRKTGFDIVNQETKQGLFKQEISYEQAIADLKENQNQFEESVVLKNKFNRLVAFDSGLYHAASSFIDKEQQQDGERLTLVFFIDILNAKKYPIYRMKTF